jgi:hypothetical protein
VDQAAPPGARVRAPCRDPGECHQGGPVACGLMRRQEAMQPRGEDSGPPIIQAPQPTNMLSQTTLFCDTSSPHQPRHYGLASTMFRCTGKARRLVCVGSTAGFGAGTGRSEAPPQPSPAHTARSCASNPEVPPHTCSVRGRRYAVRSPVGLRSDGEVVCHVTCKSFKHAAGDDAFKMDGVRACGQRYEHQPVAV